MWNVFFEHRKLEQYRGSRRCYTNMNLNTFFFSIQLQFIFATYRSYSIPITAEIQVTAVNPVQEYYASWIIFITRKRNIKLCIVVILTRKSNKQRETLKKIMQFCKEKQQQTLSTGNSWYYSSNLHVRGNTDAKQSCRSVSVAFSEYESVSTKEDTANAFACRVRCTPFTLLCFLSVVYTVHEEFLRGFNVSDWQFHTYRKCSYLLDSVSNVYG